MRYILLGSGLIATRCLYRHMERFQDKISLSGVLAPQEIIEQYRHDWGSENTPEMVELIPDDRNEDRLIKLVETAHPDFILSIQYPWILSRELLAAVDDRGLNLHNAKLPDYRGHNTISHEILNGEKEHVISLHWMDEEVDRGVLAKSVTIKIEPEDTAYSLWERTVDASVDLYSSFMEGCGESVAERAGTPIPDGGNYYSKNRISKLKEIPAWAPIEDVDRIARAFWFPPHEPAFFLYEGRKLYVMPNTYSYSKTQ